MAATEKAARVGLVAERLLENQYAQEKLSEGVESLRGAVERARQRRVKPAEDKRVYDQVRQAAHSMTEAAKAFKTGRQKPKPKWGRRIAVVVGVGAVGAAAAVAMSDELQSKLFGDSDDGPAETSSPPAGEAAPPVEGGSS